MREYKKAPLKGELAAKPSEGCRDQRERRRPKGDNLPVKGGNLMTFNPGSFLGVTVELQMLGLAAILGAVLGAGYDLLRILRISLRHRFFAVFAEDFLFALLFGGVYFLFSVAMLEGKLRFYVLAGMVAGFAVYLLTLGKIISGIFRTAVNILRKCLNFVSSRFRRAIPAKKFSEK
ncbi:MAG: spore cortex biosynthesis protein YabQ [Oscillospiraceae bacterium]|nr:spore cortex biosynthesis protein YabQ [Oscillospiraceae bacterium]